MESTRLVETIAKLREQYAEPISDMEILRQSAMRELARITDQPEPQVFTEEQRQLLIDNCDHVTGFLESEDGADSIELLMDAFRRYTEVEEIVEEEAP